MSRDISYEEVVAGLAKFGSQRKAAAGLDISLGKLQRTLRRGGRPKPEAEAGAEQPVISGRVHSTGHEHLDLPRPGQTRRFIITSAQNNTKIHDDVWATLQSVARHYDAEILVSRFTYYKGFYRQAGRVKGERRAGDFEGLWFDRRIKGYLCDHRLSLTSDLVFCGDLNIIPTDSDPFSGLDSLTGQASTIIPHAKFGLRSVATMRGEPAKMLFSTGTVTQRNYVPRKTGQKADFHHGYGGLLVEVDHDGTWFVRQLNADTGGVIYDLDKRFDPDGTIETGVRAEALTVGDLHPAHRDAAEYMLARQIVDDLRPFRVFLHDSLDFRTRNHHDRRDPFRRFESHVKGFRLVEDEVFDAMAAIAGFVRKMHGNFLDDNEVIVVGSNHDNALMRWLREADHREDVPNATYYLRASLAVFNYIEKHRSLEGFSIMRWALNDILMSGTRRAHLFKINLDERENQIVFLDEQDSFVICEGQGGGIECGMHGHLGPNGSRGSPKQFAKMGRKANTAHTHSAGIVDGVYTAGVTARLEQGYNSGPSSWSHSHIVTYPNAKRAIITTAYRRRAYKGGQHPQAKA